MAVVWVSLFVMVGCVSLRTTGAATVEDLQAEDRYKAVYGEQMTKVALDLKLFAPTASSPGVCNAGGTKQGCFEAGSKSIMSLQAMLGALEGLPVPPRYRDGDKLLREAIAENIRGLELRNRAIAENDDAAWDAHKPAIDRSIALYGQAYEAFPEDNRPQPRP